jgi:hypothetical protein
MKILKLTVVLLLFSAAHAVADTDKELSHKILGSWTERKTVTFKDNGTWILWDQKDPEKRAKPVPGKFRWYIKHGHLITFRDGATWDEVITKLTADAMTLTFPGDGHFDWERVDMPR